MKKYFAIFMLLAVSICRAEDDPDRVRVFDRDMPDTVLAIQIACGSKLRSAYDPTIVKSSNVIECHNSSIYFYYELSSPNGRYNTPTKVTLTILDYPSRRDMGGLCLLGMACVSKRYLDNLKEILDAIPVTGNKHPALL